MPSRWSRSLGKLLVARPNTPASRRTNPLGQLRPALEPLEDRVTPAVTAAQDGTTGVLTVTLDAAADAASITGTDAAGAAIDVSGTGIATTLSFTGVTGITVVDAGTNAGQSVVFNDSAGNIILTGGVSVTGVESVDVATTAALRAASVAVTAATTGVRLDADVTTTATAGQSYGGPVTVGAATVTLDGGATGVVNFTGAVDSDAVLTNNLVVNAGGLTTFGGVVGGLHPLASLATNAAGTTQLGASVTTTGGQTYGDSVTVAGPVVVLTSTTAGDISFGGTVDGLNPGPNSLTVTTDGNTSFGGAVGGGFALSSLVTNGVGAGKTSFAGNVTTSGAQTYNDPVTVSGAAVTFTSNAGSNISFNSTLDQAGATPTDVTVSTAAGTTTFGGSVGGIAPINSLTTSAGTGSTAFGTGAGVFSVTTVNGQTYNDAVKLNAATVTFGSTGGKDLLFGATVGGTSGVTTAAAFNTAGTTTFTGAVGGAAGALASVSTDPGGQTVVKANVTGGFVTFGDAVTVTPNTGVGAVVVTASTGDLTLGSTLTGTAAIPVSLSAGTNLVFGGGVTLAAGSKLTAQAAASNVAGAFTFPAGFTAKADTQVWQGGDGPGTANTTATANLLTNTPAFRNAAGTAAPLAFALRQDAAVTDATLPALAQFGVALPARFGLVSDDSTLTLTAANTTFTGAGAAGLTNLLLQSSQALSLGATITAPAATVRLNSTGNAVTQTAGGIAAASLGVRAGTTITLTSDTNAVTGTFAAAAANGDILFRDSTPFTVGTVGADPLGLTPGFAILTGVTSTTGAVAFSQPGSTPLDLTIAAPVNAGTTVSVAGGSGDDRVRVNYTIGATLLKGLAFAGNGGNDSLVLTDAGGTAAHTYTVNNGVTRDTAPAITYTDVESVSVTGSTASDTFTVTPDATAAVTVAGGGQGATPSTGDQLTVNLTGATGPVLAVSPGSDGLQGSASFSNFKTVSFSQIETLNPQADIQVTTTSAPTNIAVGSSATLTVVVTNLGPATATGVSLTDSFPAGVTASWTATASAGSTVAAASGTGNIATTADLAANGTVTFTITLTPATGFRGTVTNTLTAGTAPTAFDPNPANNQASASFTVSEVQLTVVGAGPGAGPQVKVFNADGTVRFSFFAYEPAFTGGVTVATGDVNGDGVEDIVTGSATGASHVKVFDGVTGAEIASFFAFPDFPGGVNVAVANGEVIAGAGVGGGPVVKGFQIVGGAAVEAFSFLAFEDTFRGGVQVGGSHDLLVVGAGPGGGPHVRVFDATTLIQTASFFAFPSGSTDGVSVGIGSLNGKETVLVGAGAGSPPVVATFDAQTAAPLGSVLAFDAGAKGGVRVAPATDMNGKAAVAFGPGPGGAPRVRVVTTDGTAVLDTFAFDPSFTGGVFVG